MTISPERQMFLAAMSPFVESSIPLRATILPGYRSRDGNFLRALLHIDPNAMSFERESDGVARARADVLTLVFDPWGQLVASRTAAFAAARAGQEDERSPDARIVYSLRVPVRAGGFQVRFAVRDRQSGAIGSAGGYVEIPDVERGAFALSGVLVADGRHITLSDDPALVDIAQGAALQAVRSGSTLIYTYEIYNASAPVQSAVSVWRGRERVFDAPPTR
jgi:hypothetical protein